MGKFLIDPGPSRKGWHRLSKVLRCPRLYALSYKTKQRTSDVPPAEPLIKGSLFHVGLAHHYGLQSTLYEGKDLYSPAEAIQALAQLQPIGHRAAWQRYVPQMEETLAAYLLHWAAEQWSVEGIEHELCVNVYDDKTNETYFYTQRVDLVWRHPLTGKVWFVDHKTTNRFSSKTVGGYSMNGQFIGYQMIGQKMFGDKWGGVLLNVIEWGKGGASPTFHRMPIDPAPHSVANFKNTITSAERIIREFEEVEPSLWPATHHESACWPYRKCKFYETCQWGSKT